MSNKDISSLINFYLLKEYITEYDIEYTFNKVLHLTNQSLGQYNKDEPANLYNSLNNIIEYAVENKVIEDLSYQKEQLEANITDIFISKPSEIIKDCNKVGIKDYTKQFLKLSVDTNYVKANDLKQNKRYIYKGEKGDIEISINLAKPEKDIKEIEKMKNEGVFSYPCCPLCKENVGFYGNVTKAARSNLRILPITLNESKWYFQYSPYMYYDEHCIVFTDKHINMKVDQQSIKCQLDFVEQISHYFIGTNADIPIVGGSILNHNHFQGGNHVFACEHSKILYKEQINNIKVEYLDWYLQTIRLTSVNKDGIISLVNKIQYNFKKYKNESINIFNDGDNNAVNIISRKENNDYIVYIILRNNATSLEYPFGIFHPDETLHNIKKENIGLIEAMGLAILPGRLVRELDEIKSFILGNSSNVSKIHYNMANELKEEYNGENINNYIDKKIGYKFEEVLRCCNIFKYEKDIQNKIHIIKKLCK